MRSFLVALIAICVGAPASAQETFTQAQIDDVQKAIVVEHDSQRKLAEKEVEIHRLKEEIARLRAGRPDGDTQIIVAARFIEVSTAKVKPTEFDGMRSVLVPFLDPNLKERPFPRVNSLPIFLCGVEHPLSLQIERWLQDPAKPAKVIGSPTVTTLVDKEGFLRLGHEYPITVPLSLGATTVEHRFYGLQLSFVGSLQPDGRISLEVRPKHSEIDPTRSYTINGEQVPGLAVRECELKISMRPDQQFVIGGMTHVRKITTKPARFLQPAKTADEETELLIVISVNVVPNDPQSPREVGAEPTTTSR
jgi:hypothetical protein